MSRPIELAVSGIQAPSPEERLVAIVAASVELDNAKGIGAPARRLQPDHPTPPADQITYAHHGQYDRPSPASSHPHPRPPDHPGHASGRGWLRMWRALAAISDGADDGQH
jgi:hypothetical protein